MKHEDIIRMAREAGIADKSSRVGDSFLSHWGALERFAFLVAAAEREACAKVCEDETMGCEQLALSLAAAIRARING